MRKGILAIPADSVVAKVLRPTGLPDSLDSAYDTFVTMRARDHLAAAFPSSACDRLPQRSIHGVVEAGIDLIDQNHGVGVCDDRQDDKEQPVQPIARQT